MCQPNWYLFAQCRVGYQGVDVGVCGVGNLVHTFFVVRDDNVQLCIDLSAMDGSDSCSDAGWNISDESDDEMKFHLRLLDGGI